MIERQELALAAEFALATGSRRHGDRPLQLFQEFLCLHGEIIKIFFQRLCGEISIGDIIRFLYEFDFAQDCDCSLVRGMEDNGPAVLKIVFIPGDHAIIRV